MKMNRISIAGRIVEDPEYGNLPNGGLPTIKLRVLTDDGYFNQTKKEYVKRNTYHTVKRIGKDVDQMQFRKDDWAFCEGQYLTDMWEDRDGNKKYANFIRAQHIVEIPDPWEKRESANKPEPQPEQRRDDSQRDGRDRESRDSGRGDRDGGRQRGVDDRGSGRDDRAGRDQPPRQDDIPF